ncbi:hypothetical protein TrCOL_g6915 [Triparma columacea]|uniref:Uncharacterized protein n=1 Tax=Triparma columacea TaxID=722753 RepID=A0A9W7LDH2_9STRA|nr:hypothetical protein TrCOL_g6915 [Triparma columacea]
MTSKPTPSMPLPSIPLTSLLSLTSSIDSLHVPSSGLDKSMKLLGYTCSLLSNILHIEGVGCPPDLPKGLQSVGDEMSIARYATRLCTGIPSTINALRTNSWAWGDLDVEKEIDDEERGVYPYTNKAPHAVDLVEKSLPWSMAFYYPLEHLAYAGWNMKGLIWDSSSTGKGGNRDEGRWWKANTISAVSCWAWLWYIVGDIVVQAERIYRIGAILKKLEGAQSKESVRVKLLSAMRTHKVMLAREVLFLLPGVHWSRLDWAENPWMKKWQVDMLMWMEAVVGWGNEIAIKYGY